jgi:hypothetical protein
MTFSSYDPWQDPLEQRRRHTFDACEMYSPVNLRAQPESVAIENRQGYHRYSPCIGYSPCIAASCKIITGSPSGVRCETLKPALANTEAA